MTKTNEKISNEVNADQSKNEMITISDGLELAKSDVISVFSDTKKLKPYLESITDAATVPESDINLDTVKGRKEIASRARKVSNIKTKLVGIAKESVTDLKETIGKVNQGVKFVEENLNSLRDSTRSPLNKWEAEQERIEQERIKAIKSKIRGIYALGDLYGTESIEDVSELIDAVTNIDCKDDFGEFTADALKAVSEVKDQLSNHLQSLIQQKQQEELNRKLEEERQAVEIENRLNKLRMIPVDMIGKSSKEIGKRLKSLQNYEIPAEEFGDK